MAIAAPDLKLPSQPQSVAADFISFNGFLHDSGTAKRPLNGCSSSGGTTKS